jgi:hypothetical protein
MIKRVLLVLGVLLMLYAAAQAQYTDRILRPCGSGATPYVSVITAASGDVLIVTCVGRQVLVNGAPIGGGATVSSVGLALPSIFTVTGSPVTTTGTLTGTFTTQLANRIFAGPLSGAAATPTCSTSTATACPGTATA